MATNTKVKANELRLRSDIITSSRAEFRRIDREIEELKREKKELRKIVTEIADVGRKAYLSMGHQNAIGARDFSLAQDRGRLLVLRVRDLRGCCDLWRDLEYRHVDLWVTLGNHPLD